MKITMNDRMGARPKAREAQTVASTIAASDVREIIGRYGYSPETREIIAEENLLPNGL